MASFETQRRDEAARRLMAAERRAAMDDLVAAHQSARQSTYLRNLAAADKPRAVAAGWRSQEDRVRVEVERRLQYERARVAELARVREYQYPCPPTSPTPAVLPRSRRRPLVLAAGRPPALATGQTTALAPPDGLPRSPPARLPHSRRRPDSRTHAASRSPVVATASLCAGAAAGRPPLAPSQSSALAP
jgi:hypothetical protein